MPHKNGVMAAIEEREAAIASAAHVLDHLEDGWEHRIDFSILDMKSSYTCVLGQLFGSFMAGIKKVDKVPKIVRDPHFAFADNNATPYWKDEVKRRGVKLPT